MVSDCISSWSSLTFLLWLWHIHITLYIYISKVYVALYSRFTWQCNWFLCITKQNFMSLQIVEFKLIHTITLICNSLLKLTLSILKEAFSDLIKWSNPISFKECPAIFMLISTEFSVCKHCRARWDTVFYGTWSCSKMPAHATDKGR